MIIDPTIADAVLDRLVHTAHRLALDGETLRKPPENSGKPSKIDVGEPPDVLQRAIDPHGTLCREELLECVSFDGGESDIYISAFVSGALEFFAEVRTKI